MLNLTGAERAKRGVQIAPPTTRPPRSPLLPRSGPGRPAFIPTAEERHEVACYASVGTPHEVIARVMRIPLRTLTRHFRHELTHAKGEVHARIGRSIVEGALAGDKALMIFTAKAQMGWRELNQQQLVDKDGRPVDPSAPVTVVMVNYGSTPAAK